MRSLLGASLALSGIANVLCHSERGLPRRKTLAFGPVHPHARFTTSPEAHICRDSFGDSSDAMAVARSFVSSLTQGLDQVSTFTIRDDSYTDDRTGVSHVYVRQLIKGLEVADGNINLNIKDGRVISYGDSFYRGPIPSENDLSLSQHEIYCQSLADQVRSRQEAFATLRGGSSQLPLDSYELESLNSEHLDLLNHLHSSNCDFLARRFDHTPHNIADPRTAALAFMIAATPSTTLADDLAANFDTYRSRVEVTPSHHLQDNGPSYVLTNVPDAVNPVKARIAYIQVPKGDTTDIKLVWKVEVEMEDNWYEAAIDAYEPSYIVSVVDWASDSSAAPIPKEPLPKAATYNVFAWGVNDPQEANRTLEVESFDLLASPIGWHALPASSDPYSQGKSLKGMAGDDIVNYTTTWGNNVFAHENWEGRNNWVNNYRPDAGTSLTFDYTYDPRVRNGTDAMREAKSYINHTITQLFYTSNMVHDLYYRYGFDEKSGNFQQHNFGRGGRENDAVIANAQDGSGFNNANFMTPPDGQNGRCRMYIWNTATPYRDGDLEAGIVIHELSHGLSTRLTGGPMDSSCLGWGESGGMGEGWGDFLATTVRSNKVYSDYAMGAWAANRETGIRNYVYSLNATINPSTYKTLDKPGYWGVHAIGEVWAEMLWVTSQRLIAKHGYSDTLFPPQPLINGTVPEGDFYRAAEYNAMGERKPLVPKHGNSLMVQLVIDGMKLQPCRPGFFEARDSIIQADEILTGGENYCDLWKGFSERGLGPDATVDGRTPWGGGFRTNDFGLPRSCA
ncbi:Fungalysin metallopeptidase-domain-containing protein [Gautieria morchelliformis]|nr:Fungalysin metallopeptidase-domain-containing protein [Gautieria morchelliformis]